MIETTVESKTSKNILYGVMVLFGIISLLGVFIPEAREFISIIIKNILVVIPSFVK